MAAGSQKVFSVRLVSIDYYMSPPIPGVDISYSSFQGGKVNEVPVIRVYGSTPVGQKACLHIHKAFPYLYVPCSDAKLDAHREGEAYANSVAHALEKALKLKGGAGSKRQHVHGCNLVRAKKLYGYHSSEELFVKIYLYYPQDVSRAANLLLGGAVLDKSLQPHESHIPFILQFMVDYNLYGMSHVHLSKMKFRNPVPDVFTARKFGCSEHQGLSMDRLSCQSVNVKADMGGHGCLDSLFWVSSIIPDDWMWHVTSDIDASSVQQIERQSVCELEGDATVDEIINQQFQTYTSLSQTCSNMKMVQSLIPIWEEEYERTGLREATIPPDHGKPLPKDVLKTLLNSLEFEMKLQELCCRTEDNLPLSDSIVRSLQSGTSSTDKGSLVGSEIVDHINANEQSTEADICQFQGSVCEEVAATVAETIDACAKAADTEALGLLRWLAASQAAEDINSDDELVRDTILSPLLPATSMDKVLEKANTEYESESQKECQDILESIEDLSVVECLKEKSPLVVHDHHHETSLKKQSPQVNGLNSCLSRTGTLSEVDIEGASKRNPQPVLETTPINLVNISKRKNPLWGSLPFTMTKKVDAESEAFTSHDTHPVMTRNEERACSEALLKSMSSGVHESSTLVGCSLRDLMRKKRRLRVAEQDNVDKNVLSGEQEEGGALLPKRLDFHPPHGDENEKPVASRTSGSSVTNLLVEFHDDGASSPPDFLVPKSDNCAISSDNPSEEKGAVGKNCLPAYPIVQENFATGNSSDRQFDVNGRSYEDKLFVVHDENPLGLNESADNTLLHNENFYDSKQAEDDGFPWSPAHKMVSIEGKPSIGDFDGKEGVRRNSFQNDYNIQQESVMVPTHYQNDGTLLYLLTPSSSPPSAHSVSRWLFQDHQDAPGEINASLSEPLSTEDEVQQDKGQKYKQEVQFCNNDGQSKLQVQENDAKLNGFTNYSGDVSQISGPDGRSEPTPLSQIGFRDPASVGAGQQLTLLSLEVLAETRGDLRPDPRFDAINLIVLVFQFDNDSGVEAYVLLRSNSDSYQKNSEGVSGCEVFIQSAEKNLFNHFVRIINSYDPDMLMGWDVQGGSLGFLAERAVHLGIGLLSNISRTPLDTNIVSGGAEASDKGASETELQELLVSSSPVVDQAVIQDEWGRTHASGVHVGGRVVLNLWRLMRGEVKLNMYSIEAVSEAVLRQKIPLISNKVLTRWFSSGTARARYRCIEYMTQRAKLNLEIMNQLDMVNRTSELARVFGIDFFSVLSRGSQYRVESMLLRLAHTQNYLAISPGSQQVASQPAMECLPLVMEPESRFYADPVVVLDFQSLYPSMIIAYNLCFSTCLGNVSPEKSNTLGVSAFSVDPLVLRDLNDEILLTPNGVMYVPAKVRKGVLPRLLEEILSTRIMVKQAMKKLAPSEQVLHRIFNARQLALKLIANVTYGYTAAGFSGRMPCAELADSIVQCGRCTLERAIALVNANDNWKAKVIYGDTDSMFVLLKGRSVQESFQIGHEIASAVTAMNPDPVTLKLEKVYQPCFLLTKKRYVGYSYESADQIEPIFDAKGIETVRRDTCGAVAKIMEKSLRLFFEHQDISEVKAYLQRQWKRIVSGRVSLQDFIFAKEVRLGTYSAMVSSSLPPAAIVATKAMRVDPRAEPHYAERVPYVVIHGEPGARLVDMVVDPLDLLAFDSPYRLNDVYYITKQIIPALQRVFGLLGADLNQWFSEMPRPVRESFAKRPFYAANSHRTRIDCYYMSEHCVLCGELVHGSAHLCHECLQNETSAATTVIGRTSKLEREMQHLAAICRHCGGGDWIVESGVKCTSLACSVFYERRKLQKELQGISAVAADKGFYPKCMVEWF